MIRIITDSTCEAPPELLSHPAVTVVPLTVCFAQRSLRDGIDITREQFWDILPTSNPLPTTSQATPADFAALFQRFSAAGDEVVALLISRKLSGTYDSAVIALESTSGELVDVVDSGSISVGLGLMLHEAVSMAEAGATRAEIVHRMRLRRDQVRILFTLDTLEYLHRGGRIGRAHTMVGTLLKFKPILGVVDGEVVPFSRVRNKRKAIDAMLQELATSVTERGPRVRLAVTHAKAPDEAAEVARALSQLFASPHLFTSDLGPVVGTHVGPGTVGAAILVVD